MGFTPCAGAIGCAAENAFLVVMSPAAAAAMRTLPALSSIIAQIFNFRLHFGINLCLKRCENL